MRRSLSVLGVLALLLLVARPDGAHAQAPGAEAYWTQHFEAQVNTLLRSDNPALREQGMELIITFQDKDGFAFNFSSARPQLYAVFFNPRNADAHRILALSALYATDSEKETSKTLAGWIVDEPSVRVRRHVALALQQRG